MFVAAVQHNYNQPVRNTNTQISKAPPSDSRSKLIELNNRTNHLLTGRNSFANRCLFILVCLFDSISTRTTSR